MGNVFFDKSGGFTLATLPNDLPLVGSLWRSLDARSKDSSLFSEYHKKAQGINRGIVTLHSDSVIAAMMLANDTCCNNFRPGSGVVQVADTTYISEYHHLSGEITFVLYDTDTGLFRAGKATGPTKDCGFFPIPNLLSQNNNVNMLPFYMVVEAAMRDSTNYLEFGKDIDTLSQLINTDPDSYECCQILYRISDAVYFGVKENMVKVDIPAKGDITKLDARALFSGAFSGKVVCGDPQVIQQIPAAKKTKKQKGETVSQVKELPEVRSYVAQKCCRWTDEERELIPSFPEDMLVPEEVVQCARAITLSVNDKRPIVQLGWRGSSAYGKSTGVEMLACILNKPLLRFTCSSTTEKQDFLTQIMPDTSKKVEPTSVSFDEIACDPEGAYERLTGRLVDGITCDEVMQEAVRQMAAGVSTTPRYVMQESAYIRALKNGYIVEVQESSRIRDAGVLPGLNEYDRPGALIPQVDGSYVRRHPDAIVFFTDNVGFRSCNELDPSVIRRIAFFIDSTDLPKDKAIQRIKSNTSSPQARVISNDTKLINGMYDIWAKVKKYCEDQDLLSAGGCVTIEELERWVQMTALMGFDMIETACRYCVVNKATTDYEEQATIMQAIVSPELKKLIGI